LLRGRGRGTGAVHGDARACLGEGDCNGCAQSAG
jgi:hypothetical protein